MKQYIETGKIVTTQGLKGEARVEPWCDDPAFLTTLDSLHVGKPGNEVQAEYARVQKNMVILKLRGVDTIEQAAALRGSVLYVHRDKIPLEEGQYLIQDILGLEVFDAQSGERYGVVSNVTSTGANDVYHIAFADGSVKLIPVIPQVVRRVDIAGGRIEITPLEGLFDI